MFRLKTNLMKGTLIIITLIHHRQGNIVIIGDQAFEEIEQKSLDISKTQIALRFDNKLYTPSFAMEGAYLSIKDYLYPFNSRMTPKINCNDYCIG